MREPARLTHTHRQAQFAAFTHLTTRLIGAESFEAQLALAVQPMLCAAFVATGRLRPEDVTVDETTALLAKEAANGFCIMAPADAEAERRVRGTGIYLQASRINHGECLPGKAAHCTQH